MSENNQKNIQKTIVVEKDGATFSLEVHMSNFSSEAEKRILEYVNQLDKLISENI